MVIEIERQGKNLVEKGRKLNSTEYYLHDTGNVSGENKLEFDAINDGKIAVACLHYKVKFPTFD